MSNKFVKPLSIAVGVAFVGSLAISQAASASSFSLSDLDSGYQLVGGDKHDDADKAKKEGKCGEGKCGDDKAKEGKCGDDKAKHEGKCGEGKCGDDKKKEGEKGEEGKCGEGKCGGAV
jgi:uncharacterized low-complexity protein